MISDAEVEAFVCSSFRTVWALELLQFLLADNRGHSRAELVSALRASDAVIAQSLAALRAVGLVLIEADGSVRINRADDRTFELIGATIDLYLKSPDRIRRLIISSSSPGVTAFADAFRLRKD